MRRRFLAAAAATLAAGCLAAAPAARPTTEAEVPRISVEDLKKSIEAHSVVVVDVRGQQAYEAGHVKGALLWDEAQADKLVESFKSGGKSIVTYCT